MIDSINWQQCLAMANQNTEMANDLLKMFVADLPEVTLNLQQQFAAQDLAGLEATAHRLHGATCYCGVPYLKQATQQLENTLKERNEYPIENKDLEDLVDVLIDEINAVRIAYQQLQAVA